MVIGQTSSSLAHTLDQQGQEMAEDTNDLVCGKVVSMRQLVGSCLEPSSTTSAMLSGHNSEDTETSSSHSQDDDLLPSEVTYNEEFGDLFDELLLPGVNVADALDGYLSDSCMMQDHGESVNVADQQKDETDETQSKQDDEAAEAEKMEHDAMRDGKLPRPCVGTPRYQMAERLSPFAPH